jgi:hypothetical protein
MERKLLSAIPDDGTMVNTLDLVASVYSSEVPLAARQSVLDSANKLIRKVDYNEEPFEIMRSRPNGPQPIYFWKIPRSSKEIKEDLFAALGG